MTFVVTEDERGILHLALLVENLVVRVVILRSVGLQSGLKEVKVLIVILERLRCFWSAVLVANVAICGNLRTCEILVLTCEQRVHVLCVNLGDFLCHGSFLLARDGEVSPMKGRYSWDFSHLRYVIVI